MQGFWLRGIGLREIGLRGNELLSVELWATRCVLEEFSARGEGRTVVSIALRRVPACFSTVTESGTVSEDHGGREIMGDHGSSRELIPVTESGASSSPTLTCQPPRAARVGAVAQSVTQIRPNQ